MARETAPALVNFSTHSDAENGPYSTGRGQGPCRTGLARHQEPLPEKYVGSASSRQINPSARIWLSSADTKKAPADGRGFFDPPQKREDQYMVIA
ncbi:MAG TPA: hypothetical protein VKY22_24430 [Bradyrhizobium sp.]|nr:hypothetical protein [Bradyrhizobium sp.]